MEYPFHQTNVDNDLNLTITLLNKTENENKNEIIWDLSSMNQNEFDDDNDDEDNEEDEDENDSNDVVSDIVIHNSVVQRPYFRVHDSNELLMHSSSNVHQINTNFVKSDSEYSISFRNNTTPHKSTEVQYSGTSQSRSRVTKLFESDSTYEITSTCTEQPTIDLFETFSKRLLKVALKSEIRCIIRHITKKIFREHVRNQSKSKSNKSFMFELEISNEQKQLKNSLDSLEDQFDSVLIVEPEVKENTCTLKTDANLSGIPKSQFCNFDEIDSISNNSFRSQYIPINNKSSPKTLNSNFFDSPEELQTVSNDLIKRHNVDQGDFTKSVSTHRAVGTSPINLPIETNQDEDSKLFSILNCMSRQTKSKMRSNLPNAPSRKFKSTSYSLFRRLFSRDKSKSKETGPAFFTTTYSKDKSNLSLDKIHTNDFNSSLISVSQNDKVILPNIRKDSVSTELHCQLTKNRFLETNNRSLSCNEQLTSFHYPTVISRANLATSVSYPDNSADNSAVFIIDG